MRISLIQFSIVPGDREANFEQARRHVQAAAADGADIAVLSELRLFIPPMSEKKRMKKGCWHRLFYRIWQNLVIYIS